MNKKEKQKQIYKKAAELSSKIGKQLKEFEAAEDITINELGYDSENSGIKLLFEMNIQKEDEQND